MSLFRREDLHSLAAPYALDALEPAERARFERHLKDCDSCAAEVRALSEDAVRLAWSAAAPPPIAMRDRVLAAVRTIPQEPAVRPEPVRARPEPVRARKSQLPPHVWGPSRRPGNGRGVPCSYRSRRPPRPRLSSSPRCSPSRPTGHRTNWTRRRPRPVRSPTFSRPRTQRRPGAGRTGPHHRSDRFRIGGARGRHPERVQRAPERPRAPAVAHAPQRATALPRALRRRHALGRDRTRQVRDITRCDRRARWGLPAAHYPASCPTRPEIGWIRRVIMEGSSTPLRGR